MRIKRFWNGTAIVTGSGSAMGHALIDCFAAEGLSIAALDRDVASAQLATRNATTDLTHALAIGADPLNRAQMHHAALKITNSLQNCSVLCANLSSSGEESFSHPTGLSAGSFMLVGIISTFLPMLRSAEGNRRILIIPPSITLEAASGQKREDEKFSIIALAESLRHALAVEDIGVSVFLPFDGDVIWPSFALTPSVENVPDWRSTHDITTTSPNYKASALSDMVKCALQALARDEHYIFGGSAHRY